MGEWKTYRLGEICKNIIDYRGKTPAKLGADWAKSGYRVFSAKNIKTGNIVQTDSIRYVDENLYRKWMKDEIERGDIIITSEAPFGEVYYWDSDEKIVLGQRLFGLKINEICYPKYLYYYMTTAQFQSELKNRATGTTVIGLRQPELLKCTVNLPPLDEQRRIAGILGSLDDKIELNRRINANLEAQAQALFINISRTCPTQKGILKDLIEIKYGKDHKKLNVGNIPVYGSGGIMRYVDTFIYEKETVLIPRKGSLNNVIYLNTPFWSVDTMFYSVMKYDHIAKYVYFFLKSKDLSAMNAGSAVPSMTTDILYQMEINIPDKTVFETYDTIVSPLFKQIQVNQEENQSLSALRDTLLPKLMAENSVA